MPPDNVPSPNFIRYPYPDTARILSYLETLSGVKEETKECIVNLLKYRAVRTRARFPRGPSAGVLVPLFVGRAGDLYVLLSRRSDALKSFAGDTALPGGKVDVRDVTVEDTARREAFEEIGLPEDKERVPLLCIMEPHLAKGEILVTPVVVLILDHSLQPNLNSSEVTSIFAQPLIAFLSSTPHLSNGRTRTTDPNNSYHTFTDIPWRDGQAVRLHKFLTGRESEGVKPVFGLTASILIKTATIGYGRVPDFEVQPPDAPTSAMQIAYALLTPTNPLRIACEREGVDANKAAARLLRPPIAANAVRMIKWGKIGMEWKKLMEGTGIARGEKVGSGEGTRRSVGEPVHMRIEEIKKNTIPDLATLGAFLEGTQDMVNERMREVKGDEKKLAKARKAYPKIVKRVKKQVERVRDEKREFGSKTLFASISEVDLKGGISPETEEIERGKGDVNDGKGRGLGARRGSKEMNKCNGKGGDWVHQAILRKRDAKL